MCSQSCVDIVNARYKNTATYMTSTVLNANILAQGLRARFNYKSSKLSSGKSICDGKHNLTTVEENRTEILGGPVE